MTSALGSAPDQEYLVVDVCGSMVALEMRFVQEIVRAVAVTPMPATPKWVSGVINVRGRTMAVIDLRVRLMEREPKTRLSDNMVLVEDGGIEFALLVDAALDVTGVEHYLDSDGQFAVRNTMVIVSSKTFGHRSLMMLDLENIVTDCREHLIQALRTPGAE